MSLTLTAPTVAAGDEASAAKHRDLLLAADELLEARFNSRTWLVFDCAPQLELGDTFIFGTPDNLSISGTAYDTSDETPTDPTGGDVLSYDATTKVIWLTGYSDPLTLNRRTVDYDPGTGSETWWVGTTRAQRWEPLRVADLCVEDYTDPVASVNTTLTWRSHWDKYGCIRVHNGNRFALTLAFEGGTQSSVEIPPYGILCGRRPNYDEPFAFGDSLYVHLTAENDPLSWIKRHAGQFAASMELLTDLVENMGDWCRFAPVLDTDSTSRELGSFTGSSPASTDYLWDWLWHRGKLLSVVLDRRDGTTTVTELQWNGIGSIPDASWSGHVEVDIDLVDTIRFTSDVTAPAGAADEEWEHDLIPVTTNLTAGTILALQAGSVTIAPTASGDSASHYTAPLALGTIQASTTTVYSPESGGTTTALLNNRALSEVATAESFLDSLLSDYAPAPSSGTGGLAKSFGAIGRYATQSASASWSMSEFSNALLDQAHTDGSLLEWLTARFTSISNRRRFLPRYYRKYHDAGEDVGGVAVFDSHPQDSDVEGTADGLGGALGITLRPINTSPVRIEGNPWTRQASDRGTELWIPADLLHTVASRINEEGWWADNRDRIIAGTFDAADQMIAWRIPRMIDEWNALANAINAVQEVFRADIRDLHKDPLPDDCNHPPFSYSGEAPFAVPAGWSCGRHDSDDDRLATWATLWGITFIYGVPDVDDLAAIDRQMWGYRTDSSGDLAEIDIRPISDLYLSDDTEIINGYEYHWWKAWSKESSRYLFGGAGDWSDYVYITESAAKAVFDDLGVFVMPPPAGERFNPVIEEDTGATAINGSVSGNTPAGSWGELYISAQTVYRSPSSSGTWIQVWDGEMSGISRVGFRLCSMTGSEKMNLFFLNTGASDWIAFERDVSTAALNNGPLSPRSKTLFMSAPSHGTMDGYIDIGSGSWRSGVEIYSSVPVLVIAAPEMYGEFAWNSPRDFAVAPSYHPEVDYDVSVQSVPPGGNLLHMEFGSGAIDMDALQANDWAIHEAYHCQIVQRTGVLRA